MTMLLGLDLGTTNVKAAVTDLEGRMLGHSSVPVQLFHIGEGGVEQDLEEIWVATLEAVRQATHSLEANRIRALGISSQGGAMQMLGAEHRPIGHVISWLDDRGHGDDDALTAELGRDWFVQRIGHGRSGLAAGQLLRLRRECPSLLAETHRIGFVGDIIAGRLCGRAAHDGTSCGLTLLYNLHRQAYDPDLLARLGIREGQLPDLISPRQAAGCLLPDVAGQTGLAAGIPVSAAIHDQYAAALGTGAVHAGDVMFGTGTAWVLLAVMDRLVEPVIDEAFACRHVVEDLYGQIVSLRNGGSALTWALKVIGLEEKDSDVIERRIASVEPGSNGLCFWPFLTAYGASGLAPGVKGRLAGLQLSQTSAHVLRAVIEGLACELNRHLSFLRDAHISVARLIMSGGAAAGQVTPQIIADVTGLPLVCMGGNEGSLLGAAILARGLIEPGKSLVQLAADMAPTGRPMRPGPNTGFYREHYERYRQSLPPRQSNES
ncbi:MAG: FGGY-family carbohydrate kinase [Chloroflexi bacterium]|nr:FGGY-family carbohydrate kinase [Chloroflexota bacterium]